MFGQVERVSVGQKIIVYLVLASFAALMVYPFWFMLSASLRDSQAFFGDILRLTPESFDLKNYIQILTEVNMLQYVRNTAFVTLCVTIGQIITSIMGGYAFARLNFPGRDLIFRIYLGTIMIPFVVIMIPMYKMMQTFQWLDKFESLIIPWVFTAYGTFLMRQFFSNMPKELEEAALLDGESRWGILWRIFVPLSGPAIATQFTISFLYAWNSFIWPLVAIQSKDKYVVTQALADIQGAYHAQPPLVLAGAVLVILPTVLVFVLAQRYFVQGTATTGLK